MTGEVDYTTKAGNRFPGRRNRGVPGAPVRAWWKSSATFADIAAGQRPASSAPDPGPANTESTGDPLDRSGGPGSNHAKDTLSIDPI